LIYGSQIICQAFDVIESFHYIFRDIAFLCMGLLNISFSPSDYIFLQITFALFMAILQAIRKKCQRTALMCWRVCMGALKIALLGPPQVSHRDHRLAFPERKVLALLAYLATEEGMQERQKLTRLLWPESDMAHGRSALRFTLLHLRRILQEGASPEGGSHLLITHDALGLDLASGIDLDLHALEAAWKLIRALPAPEAVKGEVRRAMIAHLQSAAVLYRGSFLQDFTLRNALDFDNWVGLKQGYWYQRIEQVFDWLSQLQSAEGSLEQAIETVERWRHLDPLNEDISLRLMQLQFASGNRTAALKAYETYQDVLMTELSAKPSPKLVTLAEVLRSTSPPRGARSRFGKCTTTARPLLNLPFVGRGTEVCRLMTLYEQACGGQPQVVLLEGESGIGKTRLAAAFLDWVRAQGANVLKARALQTSQQMSYQPLLEALRTRLEQEHDLRQLMSDPWLAELSRLLPDLRERYPDLPLLAINEDFASSQLFEALTRLLHALAAQAPLLMFVDDLQWVDAATLDVFQYLAPHWRGQRTPALLLLNRRTETRDMGPQMSEWLADLSSTISVTRLQLGPLSAQDIRQIVGELAETDGVHPSLQGEHARIQLSAQSVRTSGSRLSPERFAAWLFAQTKGQPFYLNALLQMLLERGDLVPRLIAGSGWVFEPQPSILEANASDGLLPWDVRELIQRRLARLSSPARTLLAAGTALPHDFAFEELCQVAQLAPQEALAALDESLQSLLLRESSYHREGRRGVSYHFADDKIKEVVYAEAGDARMRVLHGRALIVREQTDDSRRGASLAGLPI
jgi:DNA-binding SARP family transcriptional activator